MSSYRPTVRYGDVFRNYINSLFHATTLDRSQILRAALFAAAHSEEFQALLLPYRRKQDVPIPCPEWSLSEHGWWMETEYEREKGGENVNVNSTRRDSIKKASRTNETRSLLLSDVSSTEKRRITPAEGRDGQISSQRSQSQPDGRLQIREEGGITIRFG